MAVMTAQLTEQPSWPQERPQGEAAPPAILAVMQHALAKDPNERYPTAKMMLEALRRARNAPQDLVSVRPPPAEHNDVAFSTTLSVALDERPSAAERSRSTAPPAEREQAPETDVPSGRLPSWSWVLVFLVVGLAGLAAGVLLALQL
jgi:hypothetical protein